MSSGNLKRKAFSLADFDQAFPDESKETKEQFLKLSKTSHVFAPWGGPLAYGEILNTKHFIPLATARKFIADNLVLAPGQRLNDYMQADDTHVSTNPCNSLRTHCNCMEKLLEDRRLEVLQIAHYLRRGLDIPGDKKWTELEHGKFGENNVFVVLFLGINRRVQDEDARLRFLDWWQLMSGLSLHHLVEYSFWSFL